MKQNKKLKINLRNKRAQASLEIFLMMTFIFAFCFIISESERVSGGESAGYYDGLLPETYVTVNDYQYFKKNYAGGWDFFENGVQGQSYDSNYLSGLSNTMSNPLIVTQAGPEPIENPLGTAPEVKLPGMSSPSVAPVLTSVDNGLLGNLWYGTGGQTIPTEYYSIPGSTSYIQTQTQADGSAKVNIIDQAGKVLGTIGTINSYAGMAVTLKEKGISELINQKVGNVKTLLGLGSDAPAPKLGTAVDAATKATLDKAVAATSASDKTYMPISKLLFKDLTKGSIGSWLAPIFEGAIWGAVAAGIGYGIGAALGWSDNNRLALSLAMGAGVFTGMALSNILIAHGWSSVLWGSVIGWGAGALIGVGIFLLMFKRQDTKIATFNCMPWQPPKGAKDCEKCNSDSLRPCSEYRCKSIGANCAVVQGAGKDLCVSKDLGDVSPPVIKPNYDVITKGYKYTNVKEMPPGPGFSVVGETQECVKPFTPLKFGISLNEPAQCKIDYNDTGNFESMRYYFGESNAYDYNFTENMVLPSINAMKNSSFILYNDGKWTFYVRCSDAMGNYNSAAYAIRLCVDPSPDTTPPEILMTSLNNNGCVGANNNNALVEFYTNEPAECRWAHEDRDFNEMPYTMQCFNEIYQMNALQLYTCQANLAGIARDSTSFYVRCKDQPDNEVDKERNANRKSYVFNLRTSDTMKLMKITPASDERIYGGTSPITIQLQAETAFGCESGKSICYYSTTGNENDYIQFFETDSNVHSQSLDLTEGVHTYFVKCVDSGGNIAVNKTTFNVVLETQAPAVSRVYESSGMLKVITLKDSDCSYSLDNCDFTFPEGINMPSDGTKEHTAEWQRGKTFYIKCRDKYKNEPAECSIIVRPEDLLLSA